MRQIETLILTGTPLDAFELWSLLSTTEVICAPRYPAANGRRCEIDSQYCAHIWRTHTLSPPDASGSKVSRESARTRGSTYFMATQDWNANVDRVRDLESWAHTQPLALHIKYYKGGHNDPPESTRQEASSLVISLTTLQPSIDEALICT